MASNDNLVALKVSEIKKLIETRWVNRTIKTRPICIVGHKGVGKSDLVRQVAEEMNEKFAAELGMQITCRTTNLQFCEPPDFQGLPVVRPDEKYEEVTKHARPEILPDDEGAGIWFIDEANRCSRDNRAGLLTLIQDRAVNGHKMGKDWIIVMAMNPTDGADGVSYETQDFDAALEDRIAKVLFRGDYNEFLQYMTKKHGENNEVVQWIMNQPDVVDFNGKLRTSPRGLDYLADAIRANGGMNTPNVYHVVAAEVGMEATAAFRRFLSDSETVKAEEVLADFSDNIRKKLTRFEKEGRNDILNTLTKAVCIHIAQQAKTITDKELHNLMKYIEFIPKDAKAAFFLELGEHTRDNVPMFDRVLDYLTKNSKAIIGQYLRDAANTTGSK